MSWDKLLLNIKDCLNSYIFELFCVLQLPVGDVAVVVLDDDDDDDVFTCLLHGLMC